MQVERANPNTFIENQLPDGSRVIVDPTNERVFALNAAAGAAWDACSAPTTLSEVTESMQTTQAEAAVMLQTATKFDNVNSSLQSTLKQIATPVATSPWSPQPTPAPVVVVEQAPQIL